MILHRPRRRENAGFLSARVRRFATMSETDVIQRLLQSRRIAVVGLSDDPMRPSYEVADYLRLHGYEIIPVNPNCKSVFGRPSAASLADIDGPIDLVNVFRRPEFCEQVTRDAIAASAKGLWLQLGITNDRAARLAREAGIDFVQNRCIKIEHLRHH
jgi:predicted CoA-binding protein